MSLKNPVTPLGIDPGTVRLVAQRLKHYATPGLLWYLVQLLNTVMGPGFCSRRNDSLWTGRFKVRTPGARGKRFSLLHTSSDWTWVHSASCAMGAGDKAAGT